MAKREELQRAIENSKPGTLERALARVNLYKQFIEEGIALSCESAELLALHEYYEEIIQDIDSSDDGFSR